MSLTTTDYDSAIRDAAGIIGNGADWRLFRAQLFCESGLKPEAVSPAGAQGIAQFMPDAWAWARKAMAKPAGNPFDPADAIPTAAWYMNWLLRQWSAPRPAMDRYHLALASYNTGLGHMLEAQKRANGANDFATIILYLSHVIGHSATEPREYVERIYTIYLRQVRGY